MENPPNETEAKQIQPNEGKKTKGGIITMPFIIGITTFHNKISNSCKNSLTN